MVVGEDNKGKTSLLLSLTKSGSMVRFKEVAMDHHQQPLATNGVELGDWEYAPRGKEKVTFMTWDFGGQVSDRVEGNPSVSCADIMCCCAGPLGGQVYCTHVGLGNCGVF